MPAWPTLLLAIAVAVGAEARAGLIVQSWQVERALGLRVLAELPPAVLAVLVVPVLVWLVTGALVFTLITAVALAILRVR